MLLTFELPYLVGLVEMRSCSVLQEGSWASCLDVLSCGYLSWPASTEDIVSLFEPDLMIASMS